VAGGIIAVATMLLAVAYGDSEGPAASERLSWEQAESDTVRLREHAELVKHEIRLLQRGSSAHSSDAYPRPRLQLYLPDEVKNMPNPMHSCVDKGGNRMNGKLCTDVMIEMGLSPGHNSGTEGKEEEEVAEAPAEDTATEQAVEAEADALVPGSGTDVVTPDPVRMVAPPPPPPPADDGGLTGCDSIVDLDAWFECENNKRMKETMLPMPAPPPPPPPTAAPNPYAVEDCDAITDSLDAWFECEDNRRIALGM